ncbi:zinc-dependent alcohol dehydrogenase family protein [Levilactobacillus acidifarinae]|uniref:Enoyl reductase (ER) domain-containing protein n=1 Tax=Levilactobacillus acidifarinae DSM 19394 = JCM 15949 TaxID=1423715 RepID=A0A0R1LNZ7_9LACO|nr:zinc-dependent alcohol dehydrogenase family protein [Levilactobacillus acidifarinae]KRK94529.1 hypothetical protein FD25_GL000496 [Levilactobacillus acidifarinae DSM 19394]GEO68278.1 NADPH:quinone reductase [Levilactobacillus acidifarinae]
MSQLLRLHQFGSLDHLTLDTVPTRDLTAGEVRLQVKATSITQDTLTYIQGHLHPGENTPKFPITLGYEPAGIVTAVGPGVAAKWLGQRVAPVGPYDFIRYGSLGDEIVVPAERLVQLPDNLDFAAAAALWVPYLTAYPVLTAALTVQSTVLITAATSTVGQAAIQMAKAVGATVIGTTRSAAKAQLLRKTTAIDHVIVTGENDWTATLKSLTASRGIDLVFDAVGGTEVASLTAAMAPGGTLIEYGVLAGLTAPLPVADLLSKALTIQGFTVSEIIENSASRQQASQAILAHVSQGDFHPTVAARYPLADFRAAFTQLQRNDRIGRVVLTI